MRFQIPKPLQAEHEELHATLAQATREPGVVGDAAREVARLLHPHFVREEEFALPPLALLAEIATGRVFPEMAEVLPMTRRLKAELPAMLAEHEQIVGALENCVLRRLPPSCPYTSTSPKRSRCTRRRRSRCSTPPPY
jgi:hypothetical protein